MPVPPGKGFGRTSGVRCLLALPNGTLASGSDDFTVRLWSQAGPAGPQSKDGATWECVWATQKGSMDAVHLGHR